MLKGFRTILVSLFSLGVSIVGGTQIEMTQMQHALVAAFSFAAFSAIILLRLVTDTPVGKAVVDKVDKDIGLTPDMKTAIEQTILPLLAPLLSQVPQGASMAALVDSLQKLHASVDQVKVLAATATAASPQSISPGTMFTGAGGGTIDPTKVAVGVGDSARGATMIFSRDVSETTTPTT